jgi:hypothetical protein
MLLLVLHQCSSAPQARCRSRCCWVRMQQQLLLLLLARAAALAGARRRAAGWDGH